MAEPEKEARKDKANAKKKRYQTSEDHLRIMAEYIFKREGRPATLNEASEALNNVTRLMNWLYEHRNDLKKKKP